MHEPTSLINIEDSAWPLVEDWVKDAKNPVEILPASSNLANNALYHLQVTTRSPMGALVYHTGGILIDSGWLRVAGSGHPRLPRDPASWSQRPEFKNLRALPIADDVAGGIFAINGGDLGDAPGSIYYFAPDTLSWESLNISYSDFLQWAMNGDLETFYSNVRWPDWQKEVAKLSGMEAVNFFPFLWLKSEKARSREIISVEELWALQQELKQTL